MRISQSYRPTPHVRTLSPGFPDQQDSGGHVPWVETKLPKTIQPAAGHIGQIQRGRSGATYPMCHHRELIVEVYVDVLVPLQARKSRRDQRVLNPRDFRYVNAAVVQIGARPAL